MELNTYTLSLDLQTIFGGMHLSEQVRTSSLNADVVILPLGRKDAPCAFAKGASELYQYLQEQNVNVEIACDDDNYQEIELNSKVLRLGKVLLKDVVLPVTLGVIGNFIYDAIKDDNQAEPVVEFVSPTELNIEIVIVDTLGTRESLSIEYSGDAKDFPEVANEIEKLWNEH